MKTWKINVEQGSYAWHANRDKSFNASDLACAMGIDPNGRKRSDLVRQYATGIKAEVSEYVEEKVFGRGKEVEAMARPIIEERIGSGLYPEVFGGELDGMILGASLDGLTMDEETLFECKSRNADLFASVSNGTIPEGYKPQLEQCMMLSGAKKALFTVSDGTEEGTIVCEYESDPELRAKIGPTWKQFAEDVANYEHVETQAPIIGRAPESLPTLHVEVTGMVTASNLLQFKETALAVFKGINTDLQTDADFADAEKTVKWCKGVEDRLEQTKQHALSQTASIDELFRTMDAIKEEAKSVRLKLDKLVKGEKENRKAEIVTQARKAIEEHVAALNTRIGGNWTPPVSGAVFAEAIKGLKSIDSMRDKVSAAMANAKIEANAMADRIQINKDSLTSQDWPMVPDFAAICTKEPGDFTAVVAMRAQKRKEDEEQRLEAERARIRQEEEARAKAKVEAEQAAAAVVAPAANDAPSLTQVLHAAAPEPIAKALTTEQKAEAVIEHQDEIAAFMASRDFGKDANKVRAAIIEFIKFQAERALRKAA